MDGNADVAPEGYVRAKDLFNLEVTMVQSDRTDEAMGLFNIAAERFVNYSTGPLEPLGQLLEIDPDFYLAHFIKAAFIGRANLDRMEPSATDEPSEVAKRKNLPHLNDRERRYGLAYEAWEKGEFELAMQRFEELVRNYPTDLIVIRLLHALYLMLGQPRRMRNCLMGVSYAWKETTPHYALFLAMYAFGLEECHEYEFAREKALRALRLRPDSVWAIHAMAHCHEERSPAHHGASFIESAKEHWLPSILSGHIAWHLALYYCDLDNTDRVLEIFDTQLVDRMASGVIYSLVDAASLLWRLECCGVDPGAHRWKVIIDGFKDHIGEHQMAWFDIHLMFALIHDADPEQTSRLALAHKLLKSLEQYTLRRTGHNVSVVKKFGYQTCQGLLSYAMGNHQEACQQLLVIQPCSLECGWSTAQRQVFLLQLYYIAKQANDAPIANGALSTMREMKPYSLLVNRLKLI